MSAGPATCSARCTARQPSASSCPAVPVGGPYEHQPDPNHAGHRNAGAAGRAVRAGRAAVPEAAVSHSAADDPQHRKRRGSGPGNVRQGEPQPVATGEIEDWQLARSASRAPSGLNPADVEVLAHMPDPRIKRALQQLPANFRITVYLADVEGYTYREIASI